MIILNIIFLYLAAKMVIDTEPFSLLHLLGGIAFVLNMFSVLNYFFT